MNELERKQKNEKAEKRTVLDFTVVFFIAVTFAFVWLFVFFGGWKLLESENPILKELAFSFVLGTILHIIVNIIYESCVKRIDALEKRITELEHKGSDGTKES